MEQKRKLAVFFGGRSSEHEISIITALQFLKSIDSERYISIPVYIDPDGKFWTSELLRDSSIYKKFLSLSHELTQVSLLPEPGINALQYKSKNAFGISSTKYIPFDIAVPIFHGQFGEDGCIQGLFELANIPYTGSPVAASAVAMSKYLSKQVALGLNVPTLPSCLIRKAEFQAGQAQFLSKIKSIVPNFPIFIKPNNLGSSVGVGSAESDSELLARLAQVFNIDSEAIIEPMVTQMLELNISVGRLKGKEAIASVIEMPVASKKILTYEDKYLRGGKGKKGSGSKSASSQGMASLSRVIDPAEISSEIKSLVKTYALKLFDALGCHGVGRFDFILNLDNNSLYFNEFNPLPGSLSFYLWEKSNPRFLYPEIIDAMVEDALESFAVKATLQRNIGFKAL